MVYYCLVINLYLYNFNRVEFAWVIYILDLANLYEYIYSNSLQIRKIFDSKLVMDGYEEIVFEIII